MTAAQSSVSALIVCLALCACGSQEEPPAVKDTVFGDTVGTLDKARAVQDTTLQHKEDLDRAMDEAENAR
jgi:hypothetical protein